MSVFRALKRLRSIRVQDTARSEAARKRPFLTRLARSEAGNTMAMMAIGIFPLAGLVGGAFDMSRLYLVKTRLQQACDAGALAGRRVMGAGQWSANSNAANTAALQFFDGNFENNAYGTTSRTRSYSEASGRVTGTASVTVPMTLMRIFGEDQKVLTVSCDAEMRLPNTDIMFVLDTTGSMDQTIPGDTNTKISTLRFAVKCFYETVARLDTDANCTPGTPGPTGGVGNQTQIRFGFVPYATNVNVGRLLQNAWLANNWQYQTRTPNTTTVYAWTLGNESAVSWGSTYTPATPPNPTSYSNTGAAVTVGGTTYPAIRTSATSGNCAGQAAPPSTDVSNGAATETVTGTTNNPPVHPTSQQTVTRSQTEPRLHTDYRYNWNNSNPRAGVTGNRCRLQIGTRTYNRSRTGTSTRPILWTEYERIDSWTYQQASLDVSGLKAGGSSWNGSVSLPVNSAPVNDITLSGSSSQVDITVPANATANWGGCIEERATVRQSSYSPIPSGALDLNVDMIPSSGNASSLWGPALPRPIYFRGVGTNGSGAPSYSPLTNNNQYLNGESFGYECPTEARKLQTWATATAFQNYVNALDTGGNTYHDIGLIWGARLMSPTGLFASENALTPQGGEIERHMIFMTDGETCTSEYNYAAYGLAWYDRRQTSTGTAPTSGCVDTGTLTQQVNARFTAMCTDVKNRNITLWVVYFGSTDASTLSRMQNCATSGRFFYANNSAGLISSFRQIADQISQLRLTR